MATNPMNEIWLKCDEIKGSSTNATHKDEWPILDVMWGSQRQWTGEGQGAGYGVTGRPEMAPLVVEKQVDMASAQTMLRHINGKPLAEIELTFVRPHAGKQEVFYKVKLTDVAITSVTLTASGARPFPTERVEFRYDTAEWTYTGSDAKSVGAGNIGGKYEIGTGVAE